MAKITRFFENVNLTPAGFEIPYIIGSIRNIHSGIIDQVVISQTAGAATKIEVHIRYEQGNSDRDKLAYLFEEGTLPLFVDSHIDGPFSLVSKSLDGGLHLYLKPDAACTVSLRIDIEINNVSGL